MKPDLFLVLLTIVTVGAVWAASESSWLCRQEFGGVWSSIVIDDCFGNFWSPTVSLPGYDGRSWSAVGYGSHP